jgi:ATP-dependent DNA helicase PIF1
MPPHRLSLKVGCPIILLRNMFPKSGLFNGTRLIVQRLGLQHIEAAILDAPSKGQVELIPRIFVPIDKSMPFELHRLQLPVRLAFTMTINKSQEQNIERVGISLQSGVLSHVQLNVAVSRVRPKANLMIFVTEGKLRVLQGVNTPNVVYREVLR